MEEMSAGERPSPASEAGMRLQGGSRGRTRPEWKRDAEQEVKVAIRESDLVRCTREQWDPERRLPDWRGDLSSAL